MFVMSAALEALFVGIASVCIFHVWYFYRKVKQYPPGPWPVPVLGNLMLFWKDVPFDHIIEEVAVRWGPIFTLWTGHTPQVVVRDPVLVHQVLGSKSCSGRPPLSFIDECITKPGSVDIVFGDSTLDWQVNRRLSFSAIRKYAANPVLVDHVKSAVDQVINATIMVGDRTKIDVDDVIHSIMLLLLSSSTFGDFFQLNDPEFLRLKKAITLVTSANSIMFLMVGMIPSLRPLFNWRFRKELEANEYFKEHVMKKFAEHERSFNEYEIRDLADAFVWARNCAQTQNDLDALKFMDRWNIMNDLGNLFFAGAETTRATLDWWFLRFALHKDWQKKIRDEVADVIGEKTPDLKDRKKCHLIQAFTLEVMRLNPATRMALPHKTLEDTMIGDHKIRAGTTILVSLWAPMTDSQVWNDPLSFQPERFLDDEKLITRPNQYFLPFSSGSRSCIGERLALANIFLITARIIQLTMQFKFSVQASDGNLYQPDSKATFHKPTKYFLSLDPQ